MGSALFDVTAKLRGPTSLSLHVKSVHPDSGAPPVNESFVVSLLREAGESGPFLEMVSFDDTLDRAWQRQYARGYVKSIVAKDVKNGRRPSATLEVEVTHPAWLQHVTDGATWDSASFGVVYEFDDCAPITPDNAAEGDAPTEGDAFLLVPRAVWGHMIEDGPGLPELLEIPAYSESAYTTRDKIEMPGDVPADWIGRAVQAKTDFSTDTGGLVWWRDGSAQIATMRSGSYGAGSGSVHWIARLSPKPGRRGSKMKYATIFDRYDPVATRVVLEGATARLEFRVPPDRRTFAIHDKADVLKLIDRGLYDRYGHGYSDEGKQTALATAIQADKDASSDPWGIHREVADKYIVDYRLDWPEGKDLDAMENGARAIVDAPWPIATVHLTVTDPKWLAHLEQFPPKCRTEAIYDPQPEEPAPAPTKKAAAKKPAAKKPAAKKPAAKKPAAKKPTAKKPTAKKATAKKATAKTTTAKKATAKKATAKKRR